MSQDIAVSEDLVLWHDFNVALVTAAAGLLGLLFVALSIHIRTLTEKRNAELRSVARSLWALGLELLALDVAATIPFTLAARSGLRATGVGFDRRVTILQFVAGFGLFVQYLGADLPDAERQQLAAPLSFIDESPARSPSGLGRFPFKEEVRGSNPLRATDRVVIGRLRDSSSVQGASLR